MNLIWALLIISYVFPVSEIALLLFKKSRSTSSVREDHTSLWVLWMVILAAVVAETVLSRRYSMGRLPISGDVRRGLALGLILGGLMLRWAAILTLGKQFTVDVAIASDHHLLQSGLYKYVRHPSYTGLLLALLGVAVNTGSWGGIAIIMLPILGAMLYRIHFEELALIKTFGDDYRNYSSRTKRLIPGIV